MDEWSKLIRSPKDYWKIGPVYVWKWLALLLLAAACVLVLALFGLPRGWPSPGDGGIPSYRYDDADLKTVTGVVRILDSRDAVRYEGEVCGGACTGTGRVYDEDGRLVYEGPLADGVYEGSGAKVYSGGRLVYEGEMADNLYEGLGRRISLDSGVVSEGSFSAGVFQGEGREFYADGTLLRAGTFARDLLNGPGQEYGQDGTLLRIGTFSDGLLHGTGAQYTPGGAPEYEGEFLFGVYHGQGRLYDTLQRALAYEGEFMRGKAVGTGRVYHPSGQLLYEGQVYGGRPRADAFLGLSLAEVEAAFKEHWLLYACGGVTAFVYPYFQLMFVSETPVGLASQAARSEQAEQERQELLDALRPDACQGDAGTGEEPVCPDTLGSARPQAYGDMALPAEISHKDVTISEVLSYGAPLPGTAQPEAGHISGRHEMGWREWFSDHASGETLKGADAVRTGPFIYEFTARLAQDKTMLNDLLASGGGVRTMTVRRKDKDMALWYQAAVREDSP